MSGQLLRTLLVVLILGLAGAGLWWVLNSADSPPAHDMEVETAGGAQAAVAEGFGAAQESRDGDLVRAAAEAAEADSAGGALILLQLLGPVGRPASAAELRAEYLTDADPDPAALRSMHAPAGADGVARLAGIEPERPFRLSAGGDHWQSLTISAPPPLRPGEQRDLGAVVLTPGTCIRGRILSADGSSGIAANVALERRDGLLRESEKDAAFAWVRAADDGSFVMPGVPAGSYRLRATADGAGQALLEPLQVSGAPEDLPLVLQLAEGAPLDGVVRDAAGGALSTARVLLWHPRTGAEDLLPAPAEIMARGTPVAEDGRFQILGWLPSAGRTFLLAHAPGHSIEAVDPATAARPLEFALQPRARVAGQVFAGGQVEPAAEVRLRPPHSGEWSTITDAEGRFAFEQIPPGSYQLWSASARGSCELLPLTVLPGLPDLRLELESGPGLVVTVTDRNGHPLSEARVSLAADDLWTQGFEADWEWSAADAAEELSEAAPAGSAAADAQPQSAAAEERPERVVLLPRTAVTDAQGRAHFADLPQGVWQFHVERAGYRRGSGTVDFDVSAARETAIALHPAGALSVLLQDERDQPVAGALLLLKSRPTVNGEVEGEVTRPQTSDAQGRAIWPDLPADAYILIVDPIAPSRGGFGRGAGEQGAAQQESNVVFQPQRLTLEPGEIKELRMTVRGLAIPTVSITQAGAPAARARAELIPGILSAAEMDTLRFASVSGNAAVADGAGRARLPATEPGAYTLIVQPAISAPAVSLVVHLEAGVQEIRAVLPSGSVRGRVLGAAGPLAGASVFLMPPEVRRNIPELDRQRSPEEELARISRAAELAAAASGVGCLSLSAADGTYSFEGLPAGAYRVQIHAPPYRFQELPMIQHDGEAAVALDDCLLEGAGAVAGRVQGLEAGSWIRIESEAGDSASVQLSAGGRFLRDRLSPGRWQLAAAGTPGPSPSFEILAGRLLEFAWQAR